MLINSKKATKMTESDELRELANSVCIEDELTKPTEYKQVNFILPEKEEEPSSKKEFNSLDIDDDPEEVRVPPHITAKTIVATVKGLLAFSGPIINKKFEGKMTPEEWGQLDFIQEKEAKNLSEEEKAIAEKAAFYHKKIIALKSETQLSPEESEDLMEAAEIFAEHSNFELDPKYLFYSQLARIIGTKALNIYLA